jgi:hypothetical protein
MIAQRDEAKKPFHSKIPLMRNKGDSEHFMSNAARLTPPKTRISIAARLRLRFA